MKQVRVLCSIAALGCVLMTTVVQTKAPNDEDMVILSKEEALKILNVLECVAAGYRAPVEDDETKAQLNCCGGPLEEIAACISLIKDRISIIETKLDAILSCCESLGITFTASLEDCCSSILADIDDLSDQLSVTDANLCTKLVRIESKIDDIAESISDISSTIINNFETVLDAISTSDANICTKLVRIESKIDAIDDQLESIEDQIDSCCDLLSSQMSAFEVNMTLQHNDILDAISDQGAANASQFSALCTKILDAEANLGAQIASCCGQQSDEHTSMILMLQQIIACTCI